MRGLKREFLEETGFKIIEINYSPIKSIKQNFYADDLDHYFYSEMKFFSIKKLGTQDKTKIDGGEVKDIQWISHSDLNKDNCKIIHLNIIKDVFGSAKP